MRGTTAFGIALIAMVGLTGCGHVASPFAATPDPVVLASGASSSATTPVEDGSVVAQPTTPVVSTSARPVTAPNCLGLNDCADFAKLSTAGVTKSRKGFLWRDLEVKGAVRNTSQRLLDGELVIHFLKKGQVVDSVFKTYGPVAPGQSIAFDVTSKSAADDANVSVTTDGLSAPATGPATSINMSTDEASPL